MSGDFRLEDKVISYQYMKDKSIDKCCNQVILYVNIRRRRITQERVVKTQGCGTERLLANAQEMNEK